MVERRDQSTEELQRRIGELERELVAIHGSLSWRLTKPLRTAKRLARGRRQLPSGFTTTILNGGLGNQLFQYAAGLQVATQTGTRLRVDRSMLGRDGLRPYRLDAFVEPETVIDKQFFDYATLMDEPRFAEIAADRFGAPVVRERSTGQVDELTSITGDSVLVGYWQSEHYFAGVKDEVKRQFRLRDPSSRALEIERAIESTPQSVAVHVRRGDYVTNPSAAAVLGFLGADYYRAAAEVVSAELGDVEWFVFSDDVEWCRENLLLEGPVTHVSGATNDAEDLHLISRCDHAVIANSSFSWWGAWLGESDGSLVVAPQTWTASPGALGTPNPVPERWRRVSSRPGANG